MFFKRLPTGMFGSNCYIIGNNGEAVIIDPGADSIEILNVVEKSALRVKYIFLTHAHIDHICSVDTVRAATQAKVLAHEADADSMGNAMYNGSALFGLSKTFGAPDIVLKDGDVYEAGGMKIEIIHTPGHSPGGICIKIENNIFTGDTLFRMSIGRTDLGNGDYDEIMNSLKNKLMKLPEETVVYPGHGTSTTIGYELKHNPYI